MIRDVIASDGSPTARCRAFYKSILRDTRRNGLRSHEIDRSAQELSERAEGMDYLRPLAFQPTGVALGCPLPNSEVTHRLWEAAMFVRQFLADLRPQAERVFAHVPPGSYHVTLVNRSYYRSGPRVFPITAQNKAAIDEAVRCADVGRVSLHLCGLILTSSGGLLVPGFPCDNRLHLLRMSLADRVPELRDNLPPGAHIKLGHLLCRLDPQETEQLSHQLKPWRKRITDYLLFHDVYTPLGRLAMGE